MSKSAGSDRYLEKRLKFTTAQHSADEGLREPDPQQILGFAWRSVKGYFVGQFIGVVILGVLFIIWFLLLLLSEESDPFTYLGSLALFGVGLPVAAAGGALVAIVLVMVWPANQLAGNWEMRVETAGPLAEGAQAAICRELQSRQVPCHVVPLSKVYDKRRPARKYVKVRMGRYHGYVATQDSGKALSVVWVLWRRIRPIEATVLYVIHSFYLVIGKGTFREQQRYEKVRALREVIHACTRRGVEQSMTQAN